jgi:hypothetical protein
MTAAPIRTFGLALLLAGIVPAPIASQMPTPYRVQTPYVMPTPFVAPTAPTPTDENGNPIKPREATPAEVEAERQAAREAEARRLENIRAEEERKAAAARIDELERVVREDRARQALFEGRLKKGALIAFAIMVALLASRFLKSS